MRRYKGNMNGELYLANANSTQMEVHDLDNEKPQCQIDEIIRACPTGLTPPWRRPRPPAMITVPGVWVIPGGKRRSGGTQVARSP